MAQKKHKLEIGGLYLELTELKSGGIRILSEGAISIEPRTDTSIAVRPRPAKTHDD